MTHLGDLQRSLLSDFSTCNIWSLTSIMSALTWYYHFLPLGLRMHRPNKKICVYGHMSKTSRVGRSALIFFYLLSAKPEIVVPISGIQYFIFEISVKSSFVEAVLWRITQFFYLLCSQFWQKASGWINKTLLLIKQQKWLSEFCVKIDRVASKN
jgi:hypothetical protein